MRLLSLATAAGLITTGLAVAAPADAAGTCSLYVQSRIWISTPYRAVRVHLGPNCGAAGVIEASWTANHPTKGIQGSPVYLRSVQPSGVAGIDDWAAEPGHWTWRPDFAWDADFNPVFQYSPQSDVRLGSYGRVVPTRIGGKVNVRTTAMRYWAGGSKFIGWSAARGQIQYRTPGTAAWYGLKDVYSNSSGSYSYTYTTSAVREYRVVLNATPSIWGSTSPAVRR